MTSLASHRKGLWVGVRPDTGAMWVYDPTIQHDDPSMVFAFCGFQEEMREYPKDQVKSMLKTEKSKRRDIVIEKYLKWHSLYGANFVESYRRMKHEQREAQKAGFLRRHREFLKDRGLPFTGTSEGTSEPLSRGNRKTHCYRCHQPLDSHFFVQCNSCNWLVCHCGACGCGYDKQFSTY